jgi:PAS domain S-box-containing protein
MMFSINKILSAATVTVVLVVVIVLFISIRQSRQVSDTAKSISHTEQVLTQIQSLLLAAVDNETNSRGYIITGKNQFLESLALSEKDIIKELALLRSLTTDNPLQKSLNDSLYIYCNKRIDFSNHMVALRRDKGIEPASSLVSTGEGKFYTDRIRQIGMMMQEEENALLEERKKNNQVTIFRLNAILYGVLTAGLILIILVVQSIGAGIRKQKLSEQKFRALLDAAPDATVIVDEKGIIQMANLQIENLFGYTPGEIIGQPVEILIPQELHKRHIHHRGGFIKEARARSMGVGIELKAVKKDGVLFPVEISLAPIKTKEGILVSASVRDISGRKKTEATLNKLNAGLEQRVKERTQEIFKSEKLYSNLFENMLHGFAYCKATFEQGRLTDYIYLTVNQEYESLTGLAGITGKKVSEVMPGLLDSDQDYAAIVSRVAIYGKPEKFETYVAPLDKWLSISLYSPAKYYFVGLVENITERKQSEQKLRTAHDRLSFHIENTPLGFIEWDNQLFVKNWSKRAEEIFGWEKEEFISLQKDGYSPTHEEDLLIADKIAEQLTSGKVKRNSAQYRSYTKYGKVIWCEWFNSVLKDKEGKVIAILSLVKDITERKKAEEDLVQSERRLKEAQAITHISDWEIDLLQNIHTWSDEFYRIFGLNKDEVQPSMKLFMSFMHPDDVDFAQKEMDKAFHSFHDSTFDFRFILKDGITRYACTEWKFKFDKRGIPVRLFGIMQDITKSKEAAEELRRSIELFQYATQSSLDVIWELNFETKQYLVHKGKEKLFGINSLIDWELGLDGKYILEEDKEIVRQSFLEAGMDTTRTRWTLEYRVHSEDNSILHIINNAMFIRDGKGKAVRVIGAITDITERKRLEVELLEQQHNEQLKIIATTLEAEEKERHAIGIELHDNVNQILVATKLCLSMVKEDPVKNKAIISMAVGNLQTAIEENRKIAHELVAPDFQLDNLADQVVSLTDKMLKASGIDIQVDVTHLREEFLAYNQKLAVYRIAQEQCTNIVKYAKAMHVNISLNTEDGLFKMIIADDGIGMETEKKTKGIGLSNMRGRLSIFNGSIAIKTAPGEGFTLETTFPLANRKVLVI